MDLLRFIQIFVTLITTMFFETISSQMQPQQPNTELLCSQMAVFCATTCNSFRSYCNPIQLTEPLFSRPPSNNPNNNNQNSATAAPAPVSAPATSTHSPPAANNTSGGQFLRPGPGVGDLRDKACYNSDHIICSTHSDCCTEFFCGPKKLYDRYSNRHYINYVCQPIPYKSLY